MTEKNAKANEMQGSQAQTKDSLDLPVEVQIMLGERLRVVYGELLAEPLPDKFSHLLEQLARGDKEE